MLRKVTPGRASLFRRAGWGVSDQGLSSLANLLLNIAVARTLDPAGFGAFGLAYSVYLLLVGLLRIFLIEPYAVQEGTDRHSVGFRALLGTGALIAAITGVLAVPFVCLLPLDGRMQLAMAVSMPFLVYVEVLRSGATSSGAPHLAFALDATWTIVQVAALGAVLMLGELTAAWAFTSWAVGAALGCALGMFLLGRPRLRHPLLALRTSASLGAPWLLEFLLTTGTAQIIVGLVGVIAALDEVGAYQGAMVLLGPSTVLVGGLRLVALPEISRVRRQQPQRLVSVATALALAFTTLATVSTVPMLWLPTDLGRLLLGSTWDNARQVLPWLILYRAASAAAVGPLLGLRAIPDRVGSLSLRMVASPASMAAAAIGAMVDGARGAAIGLAVAFTSTLPLWGLRLRFAQRRVLCDDPPGVAETHG